MWKHVFCILSVMVPVGKGRLPTERFFWGNLHRRKVSPPGAQKKDVLLEGGRCRRAGGRQGRGERVLWRADLGQHGGNFVRQVGELSPLTQRQDPEKKDPWGLNSGPKTAPRVQGARRGRGALQGGG